MTDIVVNIIWPTFALVLLIFAVWIALTIRRFGHLKRTPPAAADFASRDAEWRYFEPVAAPAANLANLFEMPVLFFALVPLLLITRQASSVQVALAWAFVVFRALHSVVHLGRVNIRARFFLYLLSVIVLAAMWLGFAADMVAVARQYARTMQVMNAAGQL